MRSSVERLRARPGRTRPSRSRTFRWLGLLILIIVLGAGAAGLCVSAKFIEVDRALRWRGMAVGPGGFTLCSRANRTNCVVDGDTIHYRDVIIRIEGIDAPETHRAKCGSERALGMRATEAMLELVNAGPFEIVQRGRRDTDKYGRKLRALERDGSSLGDILIDEGLARRWDGARHSWCR